MFNSTRIAKLDAELKAAQEENEILKARIETLETGIRGLSAKAADEDEEKAKGKVEDNDEDMEEDEDDSKKAKGKKASKAEYDDEDEDDAKAAIASVSASITSLKGQISRLEKSIEARVSSTLASMGIEPIARDPKAKDEGNPHLKGAARAAAGMKVAE